MITSIRVLEPIGESTFPRCHADVFTPGVLTVTAHDDGAVMREFPAGTWERATAYDERGWPVYSFPRES